MVKLKEAEKRQAKAEEAAHKTADEVKAEHKHVEHKKEEVKKVSKEKGEGKGKIVVSVTAEDLAIVFFPLVTEKTVNMIEAENKMTFIVADKANKKQIKDVIEKAYSVKVMSVNVVRDRKGRKKAIVRLAPGFKAQELATKLGVL
jgi:ribosomal protein uL23